MDKEQLNKTIADILGLLKEGATQAYELGKEQLPQIAQEIVKFGVAEHSIYLSLGILFAIFGFWVVRVQNRWRKEAPHCEWEWLVIPSSISWVMATILIVVNAVAIMKALVAPRLFLLEYIKYLVK